MKRSVALITSVFLLFFLTHCKDRTLQHSEAFPFNLDVSSPHQGDTLFVGAEIPIDLVLSYERRMADNAFHISTDMLRRGELLRSGAVVTHWTVEQSGKTSLIFKPLEPGKHILYFNASDEYGQEQQESLTFHVENPPFQLNLSEVEKTLYKGQSATLVMELEDPAGAKVGPYQYKYIADLDGTLSLDGSSVEKANTYYPIEVGSHAVEYTPDFSAEGVQTLIFVVRDNFGREVEQMLTIEVVKNEIEVALRTDKPILYPDQAAVITLRATPSYDLGKTYELRIDSDKDIDLLSGQQPVPLGVALTEQDLQEKQYECKPRKDGEKGPYVLTATYTDRYGDSYSDALSIGVGSSALQLSLSVPDAVYRNESAPLRLHINAITNDVDYRFRIYASDKTDRFVYQGQTLDGDTFYPLGDELSPVISFSSSSLGTHTVFVEVKDGTDEPSKIQREISVKAKPIRVSLTPDKTEIRGGQSNTLTLAVTSASDPDHYDIAYEFLAGDGEIAEQGEAVVAGDSFTKTLRVTPAPKFSGELTVRATVSEKGKPQNISTADARFSVNTPNFTYTAKLLDNSIYLGDKARIGLNISGEAGALLTNPRFTFDSDLAGQIEYDGKSYAAGESISVGDKTDFEVEFVPDKAGTANLTLSFTDEFDQTQSVKIPPIAVGIPNFTYTAKLLDNSIYLGDKARVGLKISGEAGALPTNTRFTFDSDLAGQVEYGGKSYAKGASIDVGSKTDFELKFVPEAAGTANLTLSFTDEFSRTQAVEIPPIAVGIPNFTYTAKLLDNSIYLGDKAGIQLAISSDVSPTNTRFTFNSDLAGQIEYDGRSYDEGASISVGDKTNFEVEFVPEAAGMANLTLSFTDEFNQTQAVKISPIAVKYPDFSLKLYPDWNGALLGIGETSNIWIEVIPPQGDPVDRTYNWSYEVEPQSDRIVGIEPETPTEIKGRSRMRYAYQPSNAKGSHELIITATDRYGKEKTETLTFDVRRRFKVESATAFYREEGPILKTGPKFPMSFWARAVFKTGESPPKWVHFSIYCGDNEEFFLSSGAPNFDIDYLLQNPNKEIHLKAGSQGYFTEDELRSNRDINSCMDNAGEFKNLILVVETEDDDEYESVLEVPIQKEKR